LARAAAAKPAGPAPTTATSHSTVRTAANLLALSRLDPTHVLLAEVSVVAPANILPDILGAGPTIDLAIIRAVV